MLMVFLLYLQLEPFFCFFSFFLVGNLLCDLHTCTWVSSYLLQPRLSLLFWICSSLHVGKPWVQSSAPHKHTLPNQCEYDSQLSTSRPHLFPELHIATGLLNISIWMSNKLLTLIRTKFFNFCTQTWLSLSVLHITIHLFEPVSSLLLSLNTCPVHQQIPLALP